jgi:glycine/D-amino acid oxidase-like deaminating enzyme/nitrite reductase/ring-hydroxylating ferredoxin subunit
MAVQLDTTPYWAASEPLPTFPALDRAQTVDAVVVGGGITGLTAAYLLTQAGKSVALIERRRCVEIDTGHTSAHVTMVTDLPLSSLIQYFGRDHAQAAWDAGLAAIAQIDAAVRANDIACDFAWVPGYLHAVFGEPNASDRKFLRGQADAAVDLGFDAEFVDEVPLYGGPGVRFDDQARFHPRKYLAGLMRAIIAKGGHIYEHTEAGEFSDRPLAVTANGHKLSCGEIVLATHTPLMGKASLASATLFQTKLALYTTYVVAGRVAKGAVPDALFWDTGDPYHYLRIEPATDHDVVVLGGEDHKTGQADDTTACYDRLARKLKALVPSAQITHRWSGQVIETPDGLPYIGETAEHQFAATGFSGNGMTFGTLGGMMAADRVLGRRNPWSDLFDPARKKVFGGAWDYLRENKDYPYYMIRDRFAGAEARSLRAVRRGEARIVEHDGQQVAVCRDETGRATAVSAICTHMGCLVDWNEAERTWDCPCHGSRFAVDGTVLAGPAEKALQKVEGKR